jgi:hypothetical protein
VGGEPEERNESGKRACELTGREEHEGVLVLHGRGDHLLLQRPELRVPEDELRPLGGELGATARRHG